MKIGELCNKHKKSIFVAGCSVLCIAFVIAIGLQFKGNTQRTNTVSNSTSSAVIPSVETGSATAEGQKVTVESNQSSAAAVTSQPAQTDQSTQDLQPKVSKPAAPSSSEAKNPSKEPSKSSASSTSKAGDTQNGKVYVPGFGWVTNNGGGGSGTTVGNSGDQLTGNKVGNMD